jgi:hypothetical protein
MLTQRKKKERKKEKKKDPDFLSWLRVGSLIA